MRSAIPRGIRLRKTTALVISLAKLHNYCIDQGDTVLQGTSSDQLNIETQDQGYVPLVQRELTGNQYIPEQLIGAGHHFQDVGRRNRQRFDETLPRNVLAAYVEAACLTRPVVAVRRH